MAYPLTDDELLERVDNFPGDLSSSDADWLDDAMKQVEFGCPLDEFQRKRAADIYDTLRGERRHYDSTVDFE